MSTKTDPTSVGPVIILILLAFLWPFVIAIGLVFLAGRVRTEFIIAGFVLTLLGAMASTYLGLAGYCIIGLVVGFIAVIIYALNVDISDMYSDN